MFFIQRGFGLRLALQFPRGFLRHFVPNNPQPARGHPVQSFDHVCPLKRAWTFKSCQSLAERRGFEPRKPFWSLHAFQACLFNHSSISPLRSKALLSISATKLLLFFHIRKFLRIFFVILLQKVVEHWQL